MVSLVSLGHMQSVQADHTNGTENVTVAFKAVCMVSLIHLLPQSVVCSAGIIWEFVSNAEAQAPPQTDRCIMMCI